MKRILFVAALFAAVSCGSGSKDAPDPDKPTPSEEVGTPTFAKGADIGWASEMEAGGRKFRKKDVTEADLLAVLKESGINAIRLRVWVNPYRGWSGKADVVAMAKRVSAADLALMVDFHYSDFFADPSRQSIPAAWAADKADLDKMCDHVAAHTTEVLQALKDAGVTVNWVQVGNETRNGMLWPAGQLWTESGDIADGRKHFAKLYNAGYDAAKAVYPHAIVMPHLNNAFEDNLWWFQQIKAQGGKFDMIALSHYPQAQQGKTAAQMNQQALNNVTHLAQTLGVPVIISEVGVKTFASEATAKQVLNSFVTSLRNLKGCAGVFYWEPEVDGVWKPALYSDVSAIAQYTGKSETWNPYDMGAFTSSGAPTSVMEVFEY